jgi:hypothetical protein
MGRDKWLQEVVNRHCIGRRQEVVGSVGGDAKVVVLMN